MGRSNAPDVRAKDEEGDAGRLLVKFGEIGMNAHEADQPPNGSRLSCGASADGRKRPALRYELVGAQTYASSESRHRQLQALVRPRALPNVAPLRPTPQIPTIEAEWWPKGCSEDK